MTETEITGVFGTQPSTTPPEGFPAGSGPGTVKFWYCDAGVVWVHFGTGERAAYVGQVYYRQSSLMRRILRRLGL
jgi:hypothetical protein